MLLKTSCALIAVTHLGLQNTKTIDGRTRHKEQVCLYSTFSKYWSKKFRCKMSA